jgi:hypothetical protein
LQHLIGRHTEEFQRLALAQQSHKLGLAVGFLLVAQYGQRKYSKILCRRSGDF